MALFSFSFAANLGKLVIPLEGGSSLNHKMDWRDGLYINWSLVFPFFPFGTEVYKMEWSGGKQLGFAGWRPLAWHGRYLEETREARTLRRVGKYLGKEGLRGLSNGLSERVMDCDFDASGGLVEIMRMKMKRSVYKNYQCSTYMQSQFELPYL